MSSIHPRRLLESAQAGAAMVLKRTARMRRLAGSAASTLATALARHPAFAEIAEAIETAIRLLRAYARGGYPQIPYRSLLGPDRWTGVLRFAFRRHPGLSGHNRVHR